MREIHIDSVQNCFSAYLVAADTNRRIRYLEQRNRLQEKELWRNSPDITSAGRLTIC